MTMTYDTAISTSKDFVCDQALLEEIGMSEEYDKAISILTDAKHGCRRNAKDSSIVCTGNQTHKVIKEEQITKEEDVCTQRHEVIHVGTRRLYDYLDSEIPSINAP